MKDKLRLTEMAKKADDEKKTELSDEKMKKVRGGWVPISKWWVEFLCADWCSVGDQHFTAEYDEFDPLSRPVEK